MIGEKQRMKIFIDTANIEEINQLHELGIVDGVTTNPSLIAKEGRDLKEIITEISKIVNGPISAEVMSLNCNEMIKEAESLAQIHDNIVIKIPMCKESLKATYNLHANKIKVNMTLIFSAQQALLAAKACAYYVSPFIGRLDDIGYDGLLLIEEIADLFIAHNIQTKIIAASIRNPIHVTKCGIAGSHIATIPYKVLMQMIEHPLTNIGIDKFTSDYKNHLSAT